jgi:hypothetical protein
MRTASPLRDSSAMLNGRRRYALRSVGPAAIEMGPPALM